MEEEDFYSDLENEKVIFPLGKEYGNAETEDVEKESSEPEESRQHRAERLLNGNSPESLKYQEELLKVAYQMVDGTFDAKKYYGITDDMMSMFYNVGVGLFKNRQYEKAMDVFTVLTVLDPKNLDIVKAKGSCCFQLNDFMSARECFRQVIAAGEYTIKNFMRVVETSLKLHDIEATKKAAEEVLRLAKEGSKPLSKEDAGFMEYATGLLENLSLLQKKEEEENSSLLSSHH